MSNIDYIKNVQLFKRINSAGSGYKLQFNTSGIPSSKFPDVCIIKQFNLSSVVTETLYNISIYTDLIDDYIASGVIQDGFLSVTPNTTIDLKDPIIGDKYFEVHGTDLGTLKPLDTPVADVTLNLEFIRYKR